MYIIYIYIQLGIDFVTKELIINEEKVSLKLWDSAGQDRFRTLTRSFYRQADGVLILYDTTERNSFNNVTQWLKSIVEYGKENVPKYLIGNKIDMNEDMDVMDTEGRELADKNNMKFFEASAKNNINVSESIEGMAEEIYKEQKLETWVNITKKGEEGRSTIRKNTQLKNTKIAKPCC